MLHGCFTEEIAKFVTENDGKNPKENITEDLHEKDVICDWRDPNVIRVAPDPLYNSFEDCHEFTLKLKEIINV